MRDELFCFSLILASFRMIYISLQLLEQARYYASLVTRMIYFSTYVRGFTGAAKRLGDTFRDIYAYIYEAEEKMLLLIICSDSM